MRHEDITNVVYELEQNFLSSVKTEGFKGKFSSLKEAEEELSRLKKESYGPEHYLENLLEFKNHGILPWEEAEGKEKRKTQVIANAICLVLCYSHYFFWGDTLPEQNYIPLPSVLGEIVTFDVRAIDNLFVQLIKASWKMLVYTALYWYLLITPHFILILWLREAAYYSVVKEKQKWKDFL